jgi:hypothetical protein
MSRPAPRRMKMSSLLIFHMLPRGMTGLRMTWSPDIQTVL